MHRNLRQENNRLGHNSSTSVDAAHPYLNIHSAALTGNFGLVAYAITSGVNPSCVLDGVTPLHAACACQHINNEAVATYLIQCGADVNAPRGPTRRGSGESRMTRVGGAIGYTPLHFVASSGQSSLIQLLLAAGADPAIPDRNGGLAHQIAKQSGYLDIEAALLQALNNQPSTSTPLRPSPVPMKNLRLKRSIENTRAASQSPSAAIVDSMPSYQPPSEEYFSTRRPSLPHVSPQVPAKNLPSPRSKNGRRPRSAGAGSSEKAGNASPVNHAANLGRKLGTKYSLLNILRRGTEEEDESDPLQPSPSSPLSTTPPSRGWAGQTGRPPHSTLFADSSSPPRSSPTISRPGILRTQHGRASSSSSVNGSGEVSRRPSVRTLRFEDSATGSPNFVGSTRKVSSASESESAVARWRPGMDSSRELDVEEGASLQKLAVANATRVRADSDPPDSVPASAIDIPSPSVHSHSNGLASSSSPGRFSVGIAEALESDPEAPDYNSELSDNDGAREHEDTFFDSDEDDEVDRSSAQYALYKDDDNSSTLSAVFSSPRSLASLNLTPGTPGFTIRSHKEARHLVLQVQREVLANAHIGTGDLSDQLAAYGETLAIERRFARGEKQRQSRIMGVPDLSKEADGADLAAAGERAEERVKNVQRERARNEREQTIRRERSEGQLAAILQRSQSSSSSVGHPRIKSKRSNTAVVATSQHTNGTRERNDSQTQLLPSKSSTLSQSDGANTTVLDEDLIDTPSPRSPIDTSPSRPYRTTTRQQRSAASLSPPRMRSASTPQTLSSGQDAPPLPLGSIAAAPLPSAENMFRPRTGSRTLGRSTTSQQVTATLGDTTFRKFNTVKEESTPAIVPVPSGISPDPTYTRARNFATTPKLSRMGFESEAFVGTGDLDAGKSDKKRFGLRSLVQTIKGRS